MLMPTGRFRPRTRLARVGQRKRVQAGFRPRTPEPRSPEPAPRGSRIEVGRAADRQNMRTAWSSEPRAHDPRWVVAVLFVTLNACGFPFAAFGCLLAGVVIGVTNLHQP